LNLFFDTSALVKYFHLESGTDQVVELIDNAENQIWVSGLARIEFISAFYRKLRRGDIDSTQLQESLSSFDIEWDQFNQQPLSDTVITEADKLMRKKASKYGLRALDALQLASFIVLAEKDWAFIVADGVLADTVVSENYDVIRVALPST
jgi:predicted nucleic acid-binding protein